MTITNASDTDLDKILKLQYLAYQTEAELLEDYSIPPLTQTIEDVKKEYKKGIFLKAVDKDGKIVGSVRAFVDKSTSYIGKLIVHPDLQGQGIGSNLLLQIEKECNTARFELFTSTLSLKNIALYERLGYQKFKELPYTADLTFVYLEKFAETRK
jgi:ribosomal protein S18 acetylase RimI-like enzyme